MSKQHTGRESRSSVTCNTLGQWVRARIASLGFTRQTKRTEARFELAGADGARVETVIGELLEGGGALVKTSVLEHVQ